MERCTLGPRRVYGLPAQANTYVDVDTDVRYALSNEAMHTKCGWTPFAGMDVIGRVERVVLRGEEVFAGGEVKAAGGSGRVLFREGETQD